MSERTRVFVSYSHDGEEHKTRVLALADELRSGGLDVVLDRYYENEPPAVGWPEWMIREIEAADFVVVICTETYHRRFRKREDEGRGRGGTWEGAIISQQLYDAQGRNSDFIPAIFVGGSLDDVPMPLRATSVYELDPDDGYEELYRRLTGQPRVVKPPLGEIKTMPSAAPGEPPPAPRPRIRGLAPITPPLFVGRGDALIELKQHLGIGGPPPGRLVTMYAYPGMGKTSTAAMLAQDPEVDAAFPDGVFWADLGREPDLIQELGNWGRALGDEAIGQHAADRTGLAIDRLRAHLSSKQSLLIVDDVWEEQHGRAFSSLRSGHPMLLTTRFPELARSFSPRPADRYRLAELDPEHALGLLRELAPAVVDEHRDACRQLVTDLEGLPLALHVAGAMLQAEREAGLSVEQLIEHLRAGPELLEARAPSTYPIHFQHEMADMPTVGALLHYSIELLDGETRQRFIELGAFPEKPATFGFGAIAAQWAIPGDEASDHAATKESLRRLLGRGLIEAAGDERYQMHSLLHTLAQVEYEKLQADPSPEAEPPELGIDFGDEDG